MGGVLIGRFITQMFHSGHWVIGLVILLTCNPISLGYELDFLLKERPKGWWG